MDNFTIHYTKPKAHRCTGELILNRMLVKADSLKNAIGEVLTINKNIVILQVYEGGFGYAKFN